MSERWLGQIRECTPSEPGIARIYGLRDLWFSGLGSCYSYGGRVLDLLYRVCCLPDRYR
jgi:hypothetical protein